MTPEYRLTTYDNPFDPFEQFDKWFMFDLEHGYNTCGLLARIANTSSSMSDEEENEEIRRAIDEILKYDVANMYRRVEKGKFTPPSQEEVLAQQKQMQLSS